MCIAPSTEQHKFSRAISGFRLFQFACSIAYWLFLFSVLIKYDEDARLLHDEKEDWDKEEEEDVIKRRAENSKRINFLSWQRNATYGTLENIPKNNFFGIFVFRQKEKHFCNKSNILSCSCPPRCRLGCVFLFQQLQKTLKLQRDDHAYRHRRQRKEYFTQSMVDKCLKHADKGSPKTGIN